MHYIIYLLAGLTDNLREPIRVVGVVGIGHTLGIKNLWPYDQSAHIKDIMYIPPQTLTTKIIKFTFKASLYAFGGYMIYRFVPVPQTIRQTCHNAFEKIVVQIKKF